MDLWSLMERSRAILRLRAVFLLLILAAFTVHLWAQSADDQDDDEDGYSSLATLTTRYDARGNADVTFYSFADTQNWGAIEAQLEQSLHCPAGSLVHPPPNPDLPRYFKSRSAKEQAEYQKYAERGRRSTLSGECPASMTRTKLLLSTDISLASLAPELKRGGVQKLSLNISYPKSKYFEQTPGIKPRWEPAESDTPRSPATELYSRAHYMVDVGAPSPASIHLAFGLRTRDAIRVSILPVVFLLSPILICLWMRRAAIRDAKTDPTGAWFSYFRVLTWCGNSLLLIWMMGQTIRQGLEVLASYYTAAHTGSAVAISVAIMMLPPWAAFLICILISYKVYVQVLGNTWTRAEFIASQSLSLATYLLPLMCFLAAIAMISVNGQVSMGLFIGVYVTYKACGWLNVKISGTHLVPLTTGELRDHVFALAKKAAVEVRQVFVMPAGKSQMANAFASGNHHVFFTDYLLGRLNRREVSAIAAHEITHIQKNHVTWKTVALVALMLSPQILYGIFSGLVSSLHHSLQLRQAADGAGSAPGLAAAVHFFDRALQFPELILILYTFAVVLYFLHSQYLEHVADTGAVQLTGDPESVITSLLKLGRLNLSPVQWDRATGSLLTHPSTLKRVQRVARVGQVSSERLQQLLVDSANGGSAPENASELTDQFSAATAASQNPVVTASRNYALLAFKKWILRFLYIAPPALVTWTVVHTRTQHKAVIYILGGIGCLVLHLAVAEWQGVWGRKRLRRDFRAHLGAEDIQVDDRAVLVDLSPHSTLRIYALGYTWDTGYLLFAENMLCYVGDQTRFALRPEQVLAIHPGPGTPGWFPDPRIYIDWQLDVASPVQTWNLLPTEPCSFWRISRQARDLCTNLERWKSQPAGYPAASPALRGLSTPAVGEVTSQPVKSVVNLRRFMKVLFFNQVLAIAVCLTLNIPAIWYVCVIDFLALVYAFMPFWFYRDPEVARLVTRESGEELQQDLQGRDLAS